MEKIKQEEYSAGRTRGLQFYLWDQQIPVEKVSFKHGSEEG
jgi:hypothetical protein